MSAENLRNSCNSAEFWKVTDFSSVFDAAFRVFPPAQRFFDLKFALSEGKLPDWQGFGTAEARESSGFVFPALSLLFRSLLTT